MKRTILAILLAMTVTTAHAEILAQMPNDAGGKIQLSDEPCTQRANQLKAYSYTRDGTVIIGCWSGDSGDAIQVIWFLSNGREVVKLFPIDAFTRTPAGEAQYRSNEAPRQQRRSTGM